MTASFDIATLAICLGLVNLMQFVAFIIQYRIDPNRPGPGFWATASAIGCAGLAASFLRDLPGFRVPAIVAYNFSLLGGQFLVYIGIMRFLGRTEQRVPLAALAVLGAAAALAFSVVQDNFIARRVCGSLVYALLCLASCRALARHAGPDIAMGARAVAAIFAAAGLIVAALAASAALPVLGLPPLPRPMPTALTFLVLLAAGPLTSIGLIVLSNQRLAAENRIAAEDLRTSKLFLQSVLDSLTAHIALIDADGGIILVNRAWRNFASNNGLDPGQVCEGTNYLAACDNAACRDEPEAYSFADGIRKVLSGELKQFAMEYPCHAPHERRWFVGRVTPFPGDGPPRVVVAHEDITARKLMEIALAESNRKLEALSATDPLTGIANRRRFDAAFTGEYARHARTGAPLSLVMLDIDYFKNFNDAYGHAQGDACLAAVARAMADCLHRPGDLAARYGGEEFICLLPDTGSRGARAVAESIREAVAALAIPHARSSAAAVVTVSIGALTAACPPDADPGDLFRQVDALLYKAKENGRNRVEAGGDGPPAQSGGPDKGIVRLFWDEAFESGNPAIDRQHQLLIAKANDLLLLTTHAADCETLAAAVDDAFFHVAEHFRDEERLLRETGFAGLDEHAAEHERLLRQGLALARECTEGVSPADAIIRFIVHDLVMVHMLAADVLYRHCFEEPAGPRFTPIE
jgi:diguanylate cyclase (GGDEF)-like protein/hemerythrin-like metal-binding protein